MVLVIIKVNRRDEGFGKLALRVQDFAFGGAGHLRVIHCRSLGDEDLGIK